MSPQTPQHRGLPFTPPPPREGDSESQCAERSRARMYRFGQMYKAGYAKSYQTFMFSGCRLTRKRLLAALAESTIRETRQARIRDCGSLTFLYRNVHTQEIRTRTWMCNERWCPVCGPSLIRRYKWQLLKNIPPAERRLSFLTLTQHQIPGEQLRDTLNRLLNSFRRLRNAPVWRDRVLGGLYVCEITLSKTYAKTYHAHLHLILDASFILKRHLDDAWEKASGDRHCHIRRVDHAAQCSTYLHKYLSKPIPPELYRDHDGLVAALDALRNRRLVMTFGSWRGINLTEQARVKRAITRHTYPEDDWVFLGSLEHHLEQAERGDTRSQRILCEAGFGPFPLDMVTLHALQKPRAPPKPKEPSLWEQSSAPTNCSAPKRPYTGAPPAPSWARCSTARTRAAEASTCAPAYS